MADLNSGGRERWENGMGTNEAGVLEEIAQKTQSELILFFIILAIVLILIMIPLYTLILKDRKQKNQLENERLKQYMEREKHIIEVVTANTTIMAGLKATLEKDGLATNSSLTRIHDRIDNQNSISKVHGETLTRITTTLDEAVRNHATMKEDIKRILLIVDNIPQKGEKT